MPGRTMISAPTKPTPTAAHRRTPTFSPSKGTDNAVTNSGPTMNSATASANGRNDRPKMKEKLVAMLSPARTA